MATIKSETLSLHIDVIGGDKARSEMNALSRSIKDTTAELDSLLKKQKQLEAQGKKDSAQYRETTKLIEEKTAAVRDAEAKLDALRRQQDISSMTMTELRKRAKELSAALSKIDPNTELWNKVNKQLRETKSRLDELKGKSRDAGSAMTSLSNISAKYAAAGASIALLSRQASKAREAFLTYDEAMVDAMKTTNLTRSEMESLSAELAKLDTRTSQNDLLDIARIGGKLGITGMDNLLQFVRAADQINVALGRDLGNNTEDAIREIGKLVDIFNLTDTYGLEASLLKVGSAINELGMASTANEGYLVDFTKRMAGVAPNADIAIEDILGLAATLDKYGQMTETSSTAITQTITGMFSKTATFAAVAKMSVEDFTTLLNTDVNEAFLRVIEGMKQGGGGMLEVTAALNSMQLDGQRATTVLGSLAEHSEELRRQQDLARQAFLDGTSATNEFSVKNSSASAEAEKLGKAFTAVYVAVGQELNPVITNATSLTTLFVKALGQVIVFVVRYRNLLYGLATAYGTYIGWKNRHIVAEKALAIWRTATISQTALETKTVAGATKATLAWSAAKYALTGHFRTAALAARAFFASLGPIGWISIALGGLVASFGALRRAINGVSAAEQARIDIEKAAREVTDESGVSLKDKAARITTYLERINDANTAEAVRLSYIRELNALLPEEIGHIDEKGEAITRLSTKIKAYRDLLDVQSHLSGARQQRDTYITEYDEAVASGENKETKGFWRNVGDFLSYTGAANAGVDMKAVENDIITRNVSLAEKEFNEKLAATDKTIAELEAKEKSLLAIINGDGSTKPIISGGGGGTGNGDGDTYTADTWSLDKDEDFLRERAKLKSRYAAGEFSSTAQLDEEIENLEIAHLNNRLKDLQSYIDERGRLVEELENLTAAAAGREMTESEKFQAEKLRKQIAALDKAGAEQADIEDQIAERLARQRERRDNERLQQGRKAAQQEAEVQRLREETELNAVEREEQRYQRERAKYAGNAAARELVEKKHQQNLTRIRLDEIDNRIDAAEQNYKLERKTLVNSQKQELKLFEGTKKQKQDLLRRQNEELLKFDLDYLNQMQAMLEGFIKDGTFEGIDIDLSLVSPEELREFKDRLQEIYTLIHGTQEGGERTSRRSEKKGSLFGVSQEDWEALFSGDFDTGAVIDAIAGMADEAMNIYSRWADRQSAIEQKLLREYQDSCDAKKAALNDRLNAGLISEAQYNAEVEAIDADYDAYSEELELKQAKRQKAQKLSQAIINTALGVSKTLADWGVPWGLIPAGIMAALGAAEVALIATTPVMSGMASGGLFNVARSQDGRTFPARLSPESRGFISSPTVLVGEEGGEYVIPSDGLANPTLAPIISTIEAARRNGTLRRLNMAAVYPSAVSMPGRASGGYTSREPSVSPAAASPVDTRLADVLDRLTRRLDDPVRAYVSVLGKNGIKEAYDKYDNQRNRGSL